jgi:iron complex transport system substrate-binding protein
LHGTPACGDPPAQQFDATSKDLSPEELQLADADRIFYSVQGATTETEAAQSATIANPLWETLPAVRDGRAVLVDDDPWYLNAGPTAARIVLSGLEATLGRGGR